MAKVNLDALVPREDFAVQSREMEASISPAIKANELEHGAFFYAALRKPDFQRETTEWTPKRVADLISTFLDGDLIPSVILWKNGDFVFVVDGSHRLSALIAWVQDDFGDGKRSLEFFENDIPEDQKRVAEQTRKLVEKKVGSYKAHTDAAGDPDKHSPALVSRARKLGSISMPLQWVRGDAAKAEKSFVRINQQSAKITPEELELIEKRRLPNVIASRAIIRRATGHQYWSTFDGKAQIEIRAIAKEIHELMFTPQPRSGQRDSDLSAGGSVYSGEALRMVYDFTNICIETPTAVNDEDGKVTVDYLKRCRRIMQLVLSPHPQSLGFHPAVYFYSWNGKQQPMQFLAIAALAISLEQNRTLNNFIAVRGDFEEYLLRNRYVLQQVMRKHGRKDDRFKAMLAYFKAVLNLLTSGVRGDGVVERLMKQGYSYLRPDEEREGGEGQEFSGAVKTGTVIRELINSGMRCQICRGLVPIQSISIDHRERREDGGSSSAGNAQVTHPYCNSGYKESQRVTARMGKSP